MAKTLEQRYTNAGCFEGGLGDGSIAIKTLWWNQVEAHIRAAERIKKLNN